MADTKLQIAPAALKVKDACKYLGGISPSGLRRLIDRGLIKANRAMRHILIPTAELDRFLREDHFCGYRHTEFFQ